MITRALLLGLIWFTCGFLTLVAAIRWGEEYIGASEAVFVFLIGPVGLVTMIAINHKKLLDSVGLTDELVEKMFAWAKKDPPA